QRTARAGPAGANEKTSSVPSPAPAGAMPAIPYPVELGLTVLHTALYASLFLFAYLQLWLLLCYGEKRLSYRPLGLSLCLLWAALRTVLFSCYLQNSLRAGPLQRQPFPHWLLFCSPGCLLFASLCLLNLYFAEVGWGSLARGPCVCAKGRGDNWARIGNNVPGCCYACKLLKCSSMFMCVGLSSKLKKIIK
uniref:G protein-coupled receptor 137C n=1 Tax=Gopherus evgoodei TaxID=1825980 RepID=A0A8C4VJN1_9SAUR